MQEPSWCSKVVVEGPECTMHSHSADQDAPQPQVSPSSPSWRGSKARRQQHHSLAASADLSDLEQQLARARRELSRERQRSRQLRASCDALALSNMRLAQHAQQLEQRAIGFSLLPEQHGPSAAAGVNKAVQSRLPAGSNHDQAAQKAGSTDAALVGADAVPAAPIGRYSHHRWSTDTSIADQGSSSMSRPPPTAQDGNVAVNLDLQPATATVVPAVFADVFGPSAAEQPGIEHLASGTCGGLQQQQQQLSSSASKEPAGPHGQTLADLLAAGEDATQELSQQQAPQASRARPLKRAAHEPHPPVPLAAAGCSSATGSPKKAKQFAEALATTTSSSNQQQAACPEPSRPGGGCSITSNATAAFPAAATAEAAGSCTDKQLAALDGSAAATGSLANSMHAPRVQSKRPAQQRDDALVADQPLIKAARMLRERSLSAACGTELATSDSADSAGAGPASGSGAGAAGAQPCMTDRCGAAAAGQPVAEAPVRDVAGAAAAAADLDSDMRKEQPAAVQHEASDPAAGSSSAHVAAEVSPLVSSSADPPASLDDAPTPAADSSTGSTGPEGVRPPGSVRAGSNNGCSTYRRSRLSTASTSTALVVVPKPPSRHTSSMDEPRAHRGPADTTGVDSSGVGPGCEPDPQQQRQEQTGSDSHSNRSSSYSRRAAKAAKAVAKKLRKLFIGSNGASSSNHQDAAPDGRGSTSSSSGSAAGDSDLRRSWQGPFFSNASSKQTAGQDAGSTKQDEDQAQNRSSKGRRWKPPKWARRYSGYSSDSSSSSSEGTGYDEDPFGPTFSPLRHNFRQHAPQQGPAAAGGRDNPYLDPFGPAFSPLRQSMRYQPGQQEAKGGPEQQQAAGQDDDDGFGPDWLGVD